MAARLRCASLRHLERCGSLNHVVRDHRTYEESLYPAPTGGVKAWNRQPPNFIVREKPAAKLTILAFCSVLRAIVLWTKRVADNQYVWMEA